MGHVPRARRSDRAGLRRAVAASVGVHVALAAAVVVLLRESGEKPAGPGVETRVKDVAIRMSAEEEPAGVAVEPPPRTSDPPVESVTPQRSASPPPEAHTPHAVAVPNALPAGVVTLIRRPGSPQAVIDPNVKPAGTTTPAATAAPPIHGAMRAGQTVVYVLDCSGSMGEFGKLASARAALAATLRRQPEGVRFQVIAYGGTARALLPSGCVPATALNIAEAETRLAGLIAAGRSNHAEALRAAAALRPDVILLLTDADDLPATQLRAIAAAGKPIPLCVARVTAPGVDPPRELR